MMMTMYVSHAVFLYSGTPLILSPMAQKNMAILLGDRGNEGFLHENVWLFCQAAKKVAVTTR